jgi:hypothetical protein
MGLALTGSPWRGWKLWHMAALVAAVAVIMALAVRAPGSLGILGFLGLLLGPPIWLASVLVRYLRRTDDISLPPPRQALILLYWSVWFLLSLFLYPLVVVVLVRTLFALFR